jgi:hypothetical protein
MNLKCLKRTDVPIPPPGYAFVFIDEQNNHRLTIRRDDGSFTEFGNTLANTNTLISLADPASITVSSDITFTQAFNFTSNMPGGFTGVIDWGDGENPSGCLNITSASHTYKVSGEYNINIYPYIDLKRSTQFGIHSQWVLPGSHSDTQDGTDSLNTIRNYITKINNIPKTCNSISGLCAYASGFTTLSNSDAYLFTQCNTDGTFYNCTNLSGDLVEVFNGTVHGFISMKNTFTNCFSLSYPSNDNTDNGWFNRLSEIFWNNYSNIMVNSEGCFTGCYAPYTVRIPSEWGGYNTQWKKLYYQNIQDHMIDNSKHLVANGYLNSLNQTAAPANSGNIVVGGPNGQLTFAGFKDSDLLQMSNDLGQMKNDLKIFGDNFISILNLIPNGNDGITDVTFGVNEALTTLKEFGRWNIIFPTRNLFVL